ncbi:MAG: DUF4167 domain-containing protein [Alphaproteobacteria bacterium]
MAVQRNRNSGRSYNNNGGGRSYNNNRGGNSHGKKSHNAKAMYERCMTMAKEARSKHDDEAEDHFQRAEHFARILQNNNTQNTPAPIKEKQVQNPQQETINRNENKNDNNGENKSESNKPTHSTKKRYSRSTTPINEETKTDAPIVAKPKKADAPLTDGQKLFGE